MIYSIISLMIFEVIIIGFIIYNQRKEDEYRNEKLRIMRNGSVENRKVLSSKKEVDEESLSSWNIRIQKVQYAADEIKWYAQVKRIDEEYWCSIDENGERWLNFIYTPDYETNGVLKKSHGFNTEDEARRAVKAFKNKFPVTKEIINV